MNEYDFIVFAVGPYNSQKLKNIALPYNLYRRAIKSQKSYLIVNKDTPSVILPLELGVISE